MAVAIVNKVLDALGFANDNEQETENDEIYELEDEREEEVEERGLFGSKKNKIVNMPQVQSVKMVITQPTCYNDVEEVGTYLKSKKSVIINLENVGKEDARRVLDFLSGATFMIEGNIQKVSSLIYLMTPRTVEIQNDLENSQLNKQQQEQRQSFSWLK